MITLSAGRPVCGVQLTESSGSSRPSHPGPAIRVIRVQLSESSAGEASSGFKSAPAVAYPSAPSHVPPRALSHPTPSARRDRIVTET